MCKAGRLNRHVPIGAATMLHARKKDRYGKR
jgi:hypothetical protein